MLYPILFAIIAPFFTYYVSTTLFYKRANSDAPGKRPPIIPFFLPVFHTFGLAYEGPQRCFATLIKQYGSFAPFSIKAGLKSFVVLRDPNHVLKVVRASKQMTTTASRVEIFRKLFDAPKELVSLHTEGNNKETKTLMKYAHLDLPQKHLAGTPLTSLTDVYISNLSSNLNDKMFQVGFWTQIEDFWSFFQQVIMRCIIETLFGSAILRQYSSFVKDYQTFVEAADGFLPGMPGLVMSTAYEGPRERLLQGIEKWLKANHSGTDFAKFGDEDPLWDEYKGSKYIQEHDALFARVQDINLRSRAAEMLGVLYGAHSTILSATLWTVFEILYRPDIHKCLTTEVSNHYSPQSGEYDIKSILEIPLLQSVQAEAKRLRVATALTRTNEANDFPLDAQWKLSKGDTVFIFSHDLSLNTNLWAKARPRSVERPLDEFWAERFLIPDRAVSSAKRANAKQDTIESGRFSLEGLDILGGAFDGAVLGQDYAQAIQTATLAVFLTQFDLQLCDPEAFAAAIPPVRELAYGMVKPLDWITVRIRKRRMGEK